MPLNNTWVEISKSALVHNLKQFKKTIGPKVRLLISVKANAYGHGLVEVAKIAANNGADWFGVNSVEEAKILRENKINKPILVLGYIKLSQLRNLSQLKNVSTIVYNESTIKKLGQLKSQFKIHLKLETGTNRQGINPENIFNFIDLINKYDNIKIEGIYTHFANIEDTLKHGYALSQLKVFNKSVELLKKHKINIPIIHTACSAAAILYKETHFDMVRPGISVYGLWSSPETHLSAKRKRKSISLKPVLSWKSIIAQVKDVKKGSSIGYGCTEKVFRNSKIAIIPVGYWDGYDRGLSNIGNVIIKNQRAKVMGRICMNMLMVDVTDIKNVRLEDEVVLLGQQGREEISAEEISVKLGTINYEVVSRINPLINRVIV